MSNALRGAIALVPFAGIAAVVVLAGAEPERSASAPLTSDAVRVARSAEVAGARPSRDAGARGAVSADQLEPSPGAVEPGPLGPREGSAARLSPRERAALEASVRSDLASPSARTRLLALRRARAARDAALEPDVRALLERERDVLVRRVGAQILALGDVAANRATLEAMRSDADPVVRLNAAFGLARGGDVGEQAWLLRAYDGAHAAAPRFVPELGAMLESPDLRAPSVIARYEQAARDGRDPATRARAAAILRAKGVP